MIKSIISSALAVMLAPAPAVQNFVIDPDPTREHTGVTSLFRVVRGIFKHQEKGGSLEKVVDYFTSIPASLSPTVTVLKAYSFTPTATR